MDPWTRDFSAKTQLPAGTHHGAPPHHVKESTRVSRYREYNQEEKERLREDSEDQENFDQMGLAADLKVQMTSIVSCEELISRDGSLCNLSKIFALLTLAAFRVDGDERSSGMWVLRLSLGLGWPLRISLVPFPI